MRQIDVLEETSSEELELPDSNSGIIKKCRSGTKRNKQIFDLEIAEIIPSTLDDNPGTSTAI